jgi:hypothetical protein
MIKFRDEPFFFPVPFTRVIYSKRSRNAPPRRCKLQKDRNLVIDDILYENIPKPDRLLGYRPGPLQRLWFPEAAADRLNA